MIKLIIMKNTKAEVKNGKWKCPKNETLQDCLNLRYTLDSINFYTPFHDYDLAKIAIKEWGGKIVKIINPPKFVKDRVY